MRELHSGVGRSVVMPLVMPVVKLAVTYAETSPDRPWAEAEY